MSAVHKAKSGFSLIEMMILISAVGVLTALVLPYWQKARAASAKSTCLSNLQKIDSAKDLWAMDYHKRGKDVPQEDDLFGFDRYIPIKLTCPAGGDYVLEAVKVPASCTFSGHDPSDTSVR